MIIDTGFVILLVNRPTTRIIYSRGRWKSWNINPGDLSGGRLEQNVISDRANASPVIWLNYRCVPVYNYANRVSIPTGPASMRLYSKRVCVRARARALHVIMRVYRRMSSGQTAIKLSPSSLYQYVGKCGLPPGITHAYFESSCFNLYTYS